MLNYTYLIIGGGMTADAAAHAIREADPAGEIGLLSAEPHPPYNRPPLSKALWKGEAEDSIRRNTAATGAELHLGRRPGVPRGAVMLPRRLLSRKGCRHARGSRDGGDGRTRRRLRRAADDGRRAQGGRRGRGARHPPRGGARRTGGPGSGERRHGG